MSITVYIPRDASALAMDADAIAAAIERVAHARNADGRVDLVNGRHARLRVSKNFVPRPSINEARYKLGCPGRGGR